MSEVPLVGPYKPDDVLACENGCSRTARRFLSEVVSLSETLPERPTVINISNSRYQFLVGFAAALLRRQITLLPQSRAPIALAQVAAEIPGSYCLTDGEDRVEGLSVCRIPASAKDLARDWEVPSIPLEQVAAVAFTSGSTGRPNPNAKTWRALVSVARDTGVRLGIKPGDHKTVVATVPHQHMFGLEASVMFPLMHALVLHGGRPLFPADVRTALAEVPAGRILVTTPLHIRSCVAERTRLPEIDLILSATAPLSMTLAQEAERLFQTKVYEIYGFAEAGSVAARRTVEGSTWQVLDGLTLSQDDGAWAVRAAYLPGPVRFPDVVTVETPRTFVLHGRATDQVNIAGYRVSLTDLNQKLITIDGVQDGVFFLPDDAQGPVTRLMAFVVAPGKSAGQIRAALRVVIDSVFLPRPLYLVSRLPRNETGKLTHEALLTLANQCAHESEHGT